MKQKPQLPKRPRPIPSKVNSRSVQKKSGVKRHLWEDLYHRLLSISWPGFFGLLGLSYVVINLFFGLIYFGLGRDGLTGLQSTSPAQFLAECFFFSVQTFSTIGYGHISPASFMVNLIVAVQALMGLLSIGLMSGLFFSRFSRPTSRVRFSKVALITSYMNKTTLMFRMANARFNHIVEASIHVTLAMNTTTPEGIEWRQMQDLALGRNRTALFTLSWTVLHVIDEKSPLANLSLEDLQARKAQLLVSILGFDETFSQDIHARASYGPDAFVFDRQFVDIVRYDSEEVFVDINHISELQPTASL